MQWSLWTHSQRIFCSTRRVETAVSPAQVKLLLACFPLQVDPSMNFDQLDERSSTAEV